jgi:feruloyl esterase
MLMFRGRLALALVAVLLAWSSRAEAIDCQGLIGKTYADAVVVETEDVVPPFAASNLDLTAPKGGVSVKVPFCRVRGTLRPTPDSNINFEIWLPTANAWNGKYEGVGNGGFAGTVILPGLARGVEAGYAASGTDTGHSGLLSDSIWALGHPEKIEDLGWRSVHLTAVASKAIVEAYYGKGPSHSYFNGCSTGGRAALLEAQRFPSDYDGIVAGAPAIYWPQLLATGASRLQRVIANPQAWISGAKLAAINKASLAACHSESGVLDDPGKCQFDPSSLLCKDGDSESCLTTPELETVKTIYGGLRDEKGNSIYPGFAPGDEAAWSLAMLGPSEKRGVGSFNYPFPTGFYRNLVLQRADWDVRNFNLGDLSAATASATGRAVFAEQTDLSAFKAAGGKLLHYHGWHDPSIPALASIQYYEAVAAKMGGIESVQSFYRLFLGTGMEHCGGGPGPNAVGGVFGLPSPSRDPGHDVLSALAHWIEDGVAPAQITATHYQENNPVRGIVAQRPWCPFPAVARYLGRGERTQATSYTCEAQQDDPLH